MHTSGGAANSTDAEARRVQHPGTVHVRETSATGSQHNEPRDAGFPATPWEPEGCAAINRALRPRPGSGSYATIGSILRTCSGSATSPMS